MKALKIQELDVNGRVFYTEDGVPETPADIGALPDTIKYGKSLVVNGTNLQLNDQDGNELSSVTTQDTGVTNVEVSHIYSIVSNYSTFTTTAEYVGYYVIYNSAYNFVTNVNKDSLGITPGSTVAYEKPGNAVTTGVYNSLTRTLTLISGERFVRVQDVDSQLSDLSENPIQNKAIAELVPTQASSSNQLADKDFVNSSINNVAAYYITRNAAGDPFRTKAELDETTVFYSGGEVRVPTRNDYCIVIADESNGTIVSGYTSFTTTSDYIGYKVIYNYSVIDVDNSNKDSLGIVPGTTIAYENIPTARYSYQVTQWEYQYSLNNTSLTAAQVAAINSGITDTLVTKLNGIEAGAQVNTIASISMNGTAITPDANKNVDIPIQIGLVRLDS